MIHEKNTSSYKKILIEFIYKRNKRISVNRNKQNNNITNI